MRLSLTRMRIFAVALAVAILAASTGASQIQAANAESPIDQLNLAYVLLPSVNMSGNGMQPENIARSPATGMQWVLVANVDALDATPLGIVRVSHVAFGFCTYAVTSALFALGSAGLAAAALAGGITIAGVFVAPGFLNAASIAAGSFSALYSLVGAYVC